MGAAYGPDAGQMPGARYNAFLVTSFPISHQSNALFCSEGTACCPNASQSRAAQPPPALETIAALGGPAALPSLALEPPGLA